MDRLSQSPELNLIKIRAARADKNLSSAYIYTYIYIHNYSHTPPRNRRKGNASRGGNAAVCPITYPTVITAKRINPQLPFRYPSKREGAFFRVFELIEPMRGGRSSRRIRERRKEPNIGRKKEREREWERENTQTIYADTPATTQLGVVGKVCPVSPVFAKKFSATRLRAEDSTRFPRVEGRICGRINARGRGMHF